MGIGNSSLALSAWTSGAGIAIGTNIDIAGILMGPAASTVTIKVGATTVLSLSGGSVTFDLAGLPAGAVTGTSSGGSFSVIHRARG